MRVLPERGNLSTWRVSLRHLGYLHDHEISQFFLSGISALPVGLVNMSGCQTLMTLSAPKMVINKINECYL